MFIRLIRPKKEAQIWIKVRFRLHPCDEYAEFEGAARVGVYGEPLCLRGREQVLGVADLLADEHVLAQELDLIYLSTQTKVVIQ